MSNERELITQMFLATRGTASPDELSKAHNAAREYLDALEQHCAKQRVTPSMEEIDMRDYFAAKAMQALLCDTGTKIGDHTAKISYAMADAMLEARK